MAITRVRAQATANVASTASLALPLGGTATAGNALVAVWSVDKSAGTFTPPSGWTVLANQVGASVSILVCGKIAAGTETTATASFTANGGSGSSGVIAEYAGVDTASPFGPSNLPTYSDTARTSMTLDPSAATSAGAAVAFFGIDSMASTADSTAFRPAATGFTWVTTAFDTTNNGCPGAALSENLSITSSQDIAPSFSWTNSDQTAGFIQLLNEAAAVTPTSPISFVDGATTTVATAATSFTVPVPTTGGALVAGDMLVAEVTWDTSATTNPARTLPTGWTTFTGIQLIGTGTTTAHGEAFYHFVTTAEAGTSPTWTLANGASYAGSVAVARFRGVDTGDPFAVSAPGAGYSIAIDNAGGTTKVAPTVTTDVANALLITGTSLRNGSATLTSVTTGYTVAASTHGAGARSAGIAYKAQTAAGVSTTATWTVSATNIGLAWQAALNPAPPLPIVDIWTGTNGAAWNSRWTGSGGTATIQSNRGRQTTPTTSATYMTATQTLSGMLTITDTDATVTLYPTSTAFYWAMFRIGATGVGGAAWEPATGYQLWLTPGTGTNVNVEIVRYTAGSGTSLSNVQSSVPWSTTNGFRVRFQRLGAIVRYKIWAGNGTEPTAWTATVSDASPVSTPGKVGLATVSDADGLAKTIDWEDLVVTGTPTTSTMPLVDASTPARVKVDAGATSVTTASFTPPGNSLLLAAFVRDGANSADPTFTNSGTSLTWNLINVRHSGDSGGATSGTAAFAYAIVPTDGIGATTVTGTLGTANQITMKVYVLTGVDLADPIGASTEGTANSTQNLTTPAMPSELSSNASLGFFNGTAFLTSGTETGNPTSSDLIWDTYNVNQETYGGSGYKPISSNSVTFSASTTDAPANWNWVAAEIRGTGSTANGTVLQRVKAASTTQATSVTATLPAAATIGSTQILLITTTSASGLASHPTGFTQRATNTVQTPNSYVYDRVTTAATDTSAVVNFPSGGAAVYLLEVFGLSGLDLTVASNGAGPSTTFATSSLTPTTPSSFLVALAAHQTSTSDVFSAPVTLVDQHQIAGTTNTLFHNAYAEGRVTGTSAQTVTVTPAAAASSWETLFAAYIVAQPIGAPAVRSVATASSNATTNTLVCSKPTGTAVGDVLYAYSVGDDFAATTVTGSTWVELDSGTAAGLAGAKVYRRVVDGTEPSTFTFNYAGTADQAAAIVCISGANTTTPESATVVATSGNSTSMAAGSVTPSVANSLLLTNWFVRDTTGTGTLVTHPASMTERADLNATFATLAIATEPLSTATATGTRTATIPSAMGWRAVSIAVAPVATASPGPSLRSTSSLAWSSTLRTTSSIPVPTGAATGDVVVVHFYTEDSAPAVTAPTGFTELNFATTPQTSSNGILRQRVFWKRLTGADTGTYAFTHASVITEATAAAYSNVAATGTPVEALDAQVSNAAVTAAPTTSGTTTNANQLLLWSAGFYVSGANAQAPTGFTTGYDGRDMITGYKLQTTQGATGSISGTTSGTSSNYAVTLVGLLSIPTTTAEGAGTASGNSNATGDGTFTRPVATLQDNFAGTTIDSVKWSPSAGASIVNEQINFPVTSNYTWILSNAYYSLYGSSASILLVQPPNLGNSSTQAFLEFEQETNGDNMVGIGWTAGNLQCYYEVAGFRSYPVNITYDPTNHRYWQMRELAGTVYWETSPDRTTWTQQAIWSATIQLGQMIVNIGAGYYGTETSAGTAIFDNFNTTSTHSGAGTASASGNATGEGTVGTPVSSLVDNFTTKDTTKWTYVSANASVVNGRLNLVRAADVSGRIESNLATYTLVGSSVMIEGVSIPSSGSTYADSALGVYTSGEANALSLDIESNNALGGAQSIAAYLKTSGSWSAPLGAIAYSPTNHRWLRIREASGTIFFEASADASSWTTIYSTTIAWQPVAIYPKILSGDGLGETDVFDNFNYVPAVSQGAGTASGNSNATGAGTFLRKIETFVEDWSAGLDGTKWVAGDFDGTRASVTGGRLQMTTGAGVAAYKTVNALNHFTLADSSVHASFDYDPVTFTGSSELSMKIIGPGSGNLVEWLMSAGAINVRSYTNSVETATYNIMAPQRAMFFRVRNTGGGRSGGTLIFETSMDAVAWTQRDTRTITWDISDVSLQFSTGHWSNDVGSATVFVDRINSPLQTVQGAGSTTGIGTATADGVVWVMSQGGSASASTSAIGAGTFFNPENIVVWTQLSGTFLSDMGDPVEGLIVLTPETDHRVDTVNSRIVAFEPRVLELVNGSFSTSLPGNGGPDGAYFRWKCELLENGVPGRKPFYIVIPVGTIAIDVADCTVG